MGLFSRKKKEEVHNHFHTYQQQTTTIVATPATRLPACRNCNSSQRTQLAVTQYGPNTGRKYYVCIGCPAPGSGGRSWIVWANQITVY
ncbi:hypothetical protein GJ744_003344 [Endocarpon pusillum]|uniref:GRF-type domain-containing protein n=1 Tax=Endocarpon pusillum TaxID=364733 RepID=A0A8H7AA27_9EURO|nr:hypothetical protein GJ744_003344 [Endocarpon pusillum]